MKINQISSGRTEFAVGRDQKKVSKIDNAKTDAVIKSDNAHTKKTSSADVLISDADNNVINTAKVAEIKQAISEGHFKVNSDVIADRLLETVKELIQHKRSI
ncbi:flagellar biosynthesis anti-sigma factor FlgM [Nitrosomonas sp. HPC101]|uniref:flagellar biosynthesis anti-sigma factor FlgM n=1 Tax=Nitrosomonas sp. HPC101 TaxID=1658667 RepID=UPI00136C2E4C|nr:flagellar biosynthesis anti-sigma factor FlgM [Nitrosomonas sp. HPC101]